jgi:EAL domain-containing protein (putative c-di-GMP-specific phosphodiesterase class I)
MPGEARGRILIVDDEPLIRETYSDLLRERGLETRTAATGRDALQALSEGGCDVILSDIQMPDTDGIQLLRSVRERDLDVPVLLMTGSPSPEAARQAREYGALGMLMKPVDPGELQQAVDAALLLHRMARLKREALTHFGREEMLVGDRAGLDARFASALSSLLTLYQPIVSAADGSVYGWEALVRSAEPALPTPQALFEAAERLGRLEELGRAIRADVAANVALLGGQGSVFVNIHPHDLADDQLFSRAMPLTAAAGAVVFEITERASLERIGDVTARVRALRRMGFRIAIDDLGAGYAGLTTFAELHPDVAKLDMSLVRGVDHEPIKRKLIGSMAALCRELGILVVAEGVETAAEAEAVKGLGCDLLQGFHFGRPAPASLAFEPH